MSEPVPPPPPSAPPPPPGRPFTGAPRPAPRGCSRPLFVGCAALLVLLGIAAIVFVAKAKDLLGWTMRQLEQQVVASMPAEVTAAERARLERGFDAALARIAEGRVESPALFALQRQLSNAAEKSQRKELTRDDILDLLSALERVGGLLEDESGEAAGAAPAADGDLESEAGPPPAPDSP
jgi:hypothetical protein